MTPFEVANPRRRLRAHRRQAILRLADLRSRFPRPKTGSEEFVLIREAKKQVTELQNANVPN